MISYNHVSPPVTCTLDTSNRNTIHERLISIFNRLTRTKPIPPAPYKYQYKCIILHDLLAAEISNENVLSVSDYENEIQPAEDMASTLTAGATSSSPVVSAVILGFMLPLYCFL